MPRFANYRSICILQDASTNATVGARGFFSPWGAEYVTEMYMSKMKVDLFQEFVA